MHSLNNLWLAEYGFLNRALARWAEIKDGVSEKRSASEAPAMGPRGKYDIVVSGLLLPYVPTLFGVSIREWGFDVTGYDEIVEQAAVAANSKSDTVSMWISSGGGAVEGIDRAIDALRALGQDKQIIAHVENMSASAAYWLTVTASEIRANRLADIGGVGVYVGLYNGTANNTIVLRSGEFKGAGVDGYTETQLAAIQESIDDIASQFFGDVSQSRPTADMETVKTGRTWGARKALAMGLIDSITNASGAGAEPLTAGSPAEGQTEMDAKEKAELIRLRAENAAMRKAMEDEEDPDDEMAEGVEDEPPVTEPEPEAPMPEEPEAEGEGEPEEDKPDEQARQLKQLRAEIKAMRVAMSKLNGAEPLGNTGGAGAGNKPRNWNEALAYIAKRDGVGLVEAGKKAAKEFRHLHPAAAFLK